MSKDIITNVGHSTVVVSDTTVHWVSGMAICADGAGRAYAMPDSGLIGLDDIRNAGRPGKWVGVVTDNGKPTGRPIVQGPNDPNPGFLVSQTSLCDAHYPPESPKRYVDSENVPYIVIPMDLLMWLRPGDVGMVKNRVNGRSCASIVADVGPQGKLGEGSIYLAANLAIPASPRYGGALANVAYTIYRKSSKGWPRTLADIQEQIKQLTSIA